MAATALVQTLARGARGAMQGSMRGFVTVGRQNGPDLAQMMERASGSVRQQVAGFSTKARAPIPTLWLDSSTVTTKTADSAFLDTSSRGLHATVASQVAPNFTTHVTKVEKKYTLPQKDTTNNDELTMFLLECVEGDVCVGMISESGGVWKGKPVDGKPVEYESVVDVDRIKSDAKKRPGTSAGGTGGLQSKADLAEALGKRNANLVIAKPESMGLPMDALITAPGSTRVVQSMADTSVKRGTLFLKVGTDSIIGDDGKVILDNFQRLLATTKSSMSGESPLVINVISGAGKVGRKVSPEASKPVRAAIGMAHMVGVYDEECRKQNLIPVTLFIPDSDLRTKEGLDHYKSFFNEVRAYNKELIAVAKKRAMLNGEVFDINKVKGLKVVIINQLDSAPKTYDAIKKQVVQQMAGAVGVEIDA